MARFDRSKALRGTSAQSIASIFNRRLGSSTRSMVIFLSLAMLGFLSLPPIMGWWHLSAAGRLLTIEDPLLLRGSLNDARSHLLTAKQWIPSDPMVYRYLAQVNLAAMQPAQAVAELETALRLNPNSLLIREELARAYAAHGDLERAEAMWLDLSISPLRMRAIADSFFYNNEWETALEWYHLAEARSTDWPAEIRFRQVIAMAHAGVSNSPVIQQSIEERVAFNVTDGAQIPGGSLRWMEEIPDHQVGIGTPLNFARAGTIGVMYWTGEAAGLVYTATGGPYDITVQLRQGTPPPIMIRMGVDGVVVQHMLLERGDNSVSTYKMQVVLEPGIHKVHFWFDNNAVVGGLDRNAEILEFSVQPTTITMHKPNS